MTDQTLHGERRDTFLEKASLLQSLNKALAYCFAPSTRLSASQAGRSAPLTQLGQGEKTFWTEHGHTQ